MRDREGQAPAQALRSHCLCNCFLRVFQETRVFVEPHPRLSANVCNRANVLDREESMHSLVKDGLHRIGIKSEMRFFDEYISKLIRVALGRYTAHHAKWRRVTQFYRRCSFRTL